MSCEQQRAVDAHFTGTATPAAERSMREHLASCEACQTYYRRRLVLAQLDPEAPKAEERIARGLGLARPAARPRNLRAFAPIAAAALGLAAAILLFLRAPTDEGFTARGGLDGSAVVDGPRIDVFRFSKDAAQPLLVGATDAPIGADDELAFSYRNAGAKSHLMIFAVDEAQRIYWYYPAWTNAAENPRAIAIAGGPGVHELREAIRHPFAGSTLEVHGLFLDRELTVREVEELVSRRPRPKTPLAVPGAVDQIVEVEVRR